MTRKIQWLVALVVAATLGSPVLAPTAGAREASRTSYPSTRQSVVVENLHGTEVADPYRWLEDGAAPDVREWAAQQNDFAERYLHDLPGREDLTRRLEELAYVDEVEPPRPAGDRLFFLRREARAEKSVLWWREGDTGADRAVVDPNALSDRGTNTALRAWVPSPDGRRVAYNLSVNNSDETTLHVVDVDTGEVSASDRIPGTKYGYPAWTPAGDGFYYVWAPTDPQIPVAERPGHVEVRFHRLGTDPATDPVVRPANGNPEAFVGVGLSHDGHWLFHVVTTFTSTSVDYRDLGTPEAPWRTLVAGGQAKYGVFAHADRFYLVTDDGAPRRRLLRVDPARPDPTDWEEIVPEAPDAVLEDADIVGGHLGLTWRRDAAGELELRTFDGGLVRTIPLPGVGATDGLRGQPDGDVAYFGFSSLLRPGEVYRTQISTGATDRWAKADVPFDPDSFTVERVTYPSKDGTRIPMFLVHRKDLRRNGSTPFLLTGYGGFGVNMEPNFRTSVVPWLESGGGFALANLRGGGEYGEDWHRAGMLGNKQNVFDDFIAAAEWLVDREYTRPSRLGIQGASNGGLLVGAALTQRPELFGAVICTVPLLDMVRYHHFGSGRTWVTEYGSAERPEDFAWLYAYSPYHRVEQGRRYPAVLFGSADSDDRVDPLHARKMAAALQAATGDARRPVLLRVEAGAGHGGADQIRSFVEATADSYLFLFAQLGSEAR